MDVEQQAILLMADISGYTQFMLSTRKSLRHGQMVITQLMQALLKEVHIPLQIAKLEGDAIFLYALKGDAKQWAETQALIRQKLFLFLQVFEKKIAELTALNICTCQACHSIHKLKLKLIGHSGQALLYQLNHFQELSGVDVILVHRLLKNSIAQNQYILLTETAFQDLCLAKEKKPWLAGEEKVEGIGIVKTFLFVPSESWQEEIKQRAQKKATLAAKWKLAFSKAVGEAMIALGLRKPLAYSHRFDGKPTTKSDSNLQENEKEID